MDKVVYRYDIEVSTDTQRIEVPTYAKFLKAVPRLQGDTAYIALYFEHSAHFKETEFRQFRLFSTGETFPNDEHSYLDTVHFPCCDEIYHIYEKFTSNLLAFRYPSPIKPKKAKAMYVSNLVH